jgi:hypothetical protein
VADWRHAMLGLPAPARPARPPAPRLATLLAALAATASAGACESGPTPAPAEPRSGLVVLAGEPGAATITVHDANGAPRGIAPPEPGTGWLAAGTEQRLIATLDDGTIRVSAPIGGEEAPAWAEAVGENEEVPEDPLWFATWSPNGRRVAAIASDLGEAGRLTVLLADPVEGDTLLLPVARRPVPAAPVWLDDDRVLVQSTIGFAVVDTTTGDVGLGPSWDVGPGIAIAVSANGSRVAVADPAAGAIEVFERDAWLTGSGEPLARIEAGGEAGSVALDHAGDRLAVVWQQLDGPGTLIVYAGAADWAEVDRFALPGESARAAVSWLGR